MRLGRISRFNHGGGDIFDSYRFYLVKLYIQPETEINWHNFRDLDFYVLCYFPVYFDISFVISRF